jgi:hypothetical protein
MKRVKVKDLHPGKWQDGMELVLATIVRISDGEVINSGVTGVRELNSTDARGMFGTDNDALQSLSPTESGWDFTMFNFTTITDEQRKTLFEEGEISWGPAYSKWYVSII